MNYKNAQKVSCIESFELLPIKYAAEFKEKAVAIMRVNSNCALMMHIRGQVATHPEAIDGIEELFHKYGFRDVWRQV